MKKYVLNILLIIIALCALIYGCDTECTSSQQSISSEDTSTTISTSSTNTTLPGDSSDDPTTTTSTTLPGDPSDDPTTTTSTTLPGDPSDDPTTTTSTTSTTVPQGDESGDPITTTTTTIAGGYEPAGESNIIAFTINVSDVTMDSIESVAVKLGGGIYAERKEYDKDVNVKKAKLTITKNSDRTGIVTFEYKDTDNDLGGYKVFASLTLKDVNKKTLGNVKEIFQGDYVLPDPDADEECIKYPITVIIDAIYGDADVTLK